MQNISRSKSFGKFVLIVRKILIEFKMLDESPLSSIRIFLYTKITKDFLINRPIIITVQFKPVQQSKR